MPKFMHLAALLSDGSTTQVTSETIMDILNAVTSQFSITQIVAMIAGILGVTIGFVFLWWAIRKGSKLIIKAATKGKFGI